MAETPPPVYTVSNTAVEPFGDTPPPPSYETAIGLPNTGGNHRNRSNVITPVPASRTRSTPGQQINQRELQRSNVTCCRPKCNDSYCKSFRKATGFAQYLFVTFTVFCVLNIVAVVVGATYFHSCPDNNRVAHILVSSGCIGATYGIIMAIEFYLLDIKKGISHDEKEKNKPGPCKVLQPCLGLAGIGLFIYYCVIIFGEPFGGGELCSSVLYYFGFVYAVFGIAYFSLSLIILVLIRVWVKWMCGMT